MLLSNLDKNINATITNVNCSEELKQRFYSFGMIEGAEILVEEISLAKNTMALLIDGTSVAIRIDEAKQIEVEVA